MRTAIPHSKWTEAQALKRQGAREALRELAEWIDDQDAVANCECINFRACAAEARRRAEEMSNGS